MECGVSNNARKKEEKQKKKKKQQQQQQQKQEKKDIGCSLFFWHGSSGERWHSIFRNGLKNMSNIDCVNGSWYGPGIYLAVDAAMSLGYTHTVENKSIALCEVVPNSMFKNFGSFATLQDNDAIIVRFVFPVANENFRTSCIANLIDKNSIPTIDDVLNYLKDKDQYKF